MARIEINDSALLTALIKTDMLELVNEQRPGKGRFGTGSVAN